MLGCHLAFPDIWGQCWCPKWLCRLWWPGVCNSSHQAGNDCVLPNAHTLDSVMSRSNRQSVWVYGPVLITLVIQVCKEVSYFTHMSRNGICVPFCAPANPVLEHGIIRFWWFRPPWSEQEWWSSCWKVCWAIFLLEIGHTARRGTMSGRDPSTVSSIWFSCGDINRG